MGALSTMTKDEIEVALTAAAERELTARRTGAWAMQEICMSEIRQLRTLLQEATRAE